MIDIVKLDENNKSYYVENLKNRAEAVQRDVLDAVEEILEDVRKNGDSAVIKYTNKFDSKNISEQNVKVSVDEIKKA